MVTISVELSDYDLEEMLEDGHGDMSSALTGTIVNAVSRRIESRIKTEVNKRVDARVGQLIDNTILDKTRMVLKDFLSQPVNQTDRYGDTIAHHDSVYNMIKEAFDDIANARVDRNGKLLGKGKCGYNEYTNLNFLIREMAKESAQKMAKEVISAANKTIEASITKEVKETLADDIAKKLLAQRDVK